MRESFGLLVVCAAAFCAMNALARRCGSSRALLSVRVLQSAGFLVVAHGAQAVVPVLLVSVAYVVVKPAVRWRGVTAGAWALGVALLLVNEFAGRRLDTRLLLSALGVDHRAGVVADLLQYGQLYRWQSAWNLLMLRLISFFIDWCAAATPPLVQP
jgi:hypothetical protein